ncbi:MAG: dienelactone hydrolase family protein [Nitrososphaerales archaeon]|nr:dienelactone hydrolase family protein [Nitrososphaerales archaeon]
MPKAPSRSEQIPMYRIEPDGATACIVVLHEVWGLVPHIRDVCKRLGKLGFSAIAPDLYWERKTLLSPESIQKAMEGVWDLSLEERRDKAKVHKAMIRKGFGHDTLAVTSTLYSKRFRDLLVSDASSSVKLVHSKYGRVSVLGFCLGGGLALKVAARLGDLSSIVSFYGEPPSSNEVRRISTPVLAIHATNDEIINTKVPAFVETALAAGKDLTLKIYPRTRHGFFNDTNSSVYNERAAAEAWELATWFLRRTLR